MNIELQLRKDPDYRLWSGIGFAYSVLFLPSMFYLAFFIVLPLIKGKGANLHYILLPLLVICLAIIFLFPIGERKKSGLKSGFNRIPHLITDILNFVMLAIVYIIGVGPVSVISKINSKHYLDLKSSGSTWIKKEQKKPKLEEFYRAF